jgi:hypothetical protein
LTSCVPSVPIRRATAALVANETRVVSTDRIGPLQANHPTLLPILAGSPDNDRKLVK